MSTWKTIQPSECNWNVFDKIGKDWMLISAAKADGSVNTMTASWGGAGIMWGMPICFCGIRPQRYTFEFVEEAEFFTLSFFEEGHRDILNYCGSQSGRQEDKIVKAGLTLVKELDVPAFEQAQMTLVCRKLYSDFLKKEGFCDASIPEKMYKAGDYHKLYFGEIVKIYTR